MVEAPVDSKCFKLRSYKFRARSVVSVQLILTAQDSPPYCLGLGGNSEQSRNQGASLNNASTSLAAAAECK